jgi:hypothetical protein
MLLGDQNRSAAKLIEIFADQRRVRDNALRRSQCGHFDEWIIVDDMVQTSAVTRSSFEDISVSCAATSTFRANGDIGVYRRRKGAKWT